MINDFERFLLERFSDESEVRFNNLLEWRGYNLDFKWMVDEIYNKLCENNGWIRIGDNFIKKHIEHDFSGKAFLGNTKITFGLNTGRNRNAIHECVADTDNSKLCIITENGEKRGYNPQADVNVENKNIVLDDCSIIIELSSKTSLIPEYEFKASFWHELMHLYQYYSELIKNKGVLPYNVKLNSAKYDKVSSGFWTYGKNNNLLMRKICSLLYRLDQDEINANMSMIYPFIETNYHIRFSNIKEYLPYLEIYKTIVLANEVKEIMEKVVSDKGTKEMIDRELCKIFSHAYKENDCSKLLLQHLIKIIPYLQDKAYRNIRSALEDFNRPTPLTEISAKMISFFE